MNQSNGDLGTPDGCIGQIEKFVEAGCRHFIFGIGGKDWDEVIRLFGRKVIPYFKEMQKAQHVEV